VLSLGLQAGEPAAVVDAVQAPLAVGASVAVPELPRLPAGQVWELWAALQQERDATVVFVGSEWCWRLLDAHEQLAPALRAELSARWAEQPFRHTVAVAAPGTVLSRDLSQRWTEVFGCPLTWHFACAEAGSLYTVRPRAGAGVPGHEGRCVEGLSWRVSSGELWVQGSGLFERYHGRPRSTAAAFAPEDGFCRTFHPVEPAPEGPLPAPGAFEEDLVNATEYHLCHGPDAPRGPRMDADWAVKKVPMRVYEMWRTAWGGLDVTKKHNTAWKVYWSKYR